MDYIHVTAAAIIRRNEKYLLVKERTSSGQIVYNQPAGHVEFNESIEAAVIREVMEETGLDFKPTALTGTYLVSPALNGKTYLRFCFVGETSEQQPAKPQDPDILENLWLTKEEILKIPKKELRSGMVLKCIKDYLRGVRIPLETLSFYNDELQLIKQSTQLLKS